MLPSLTLALLAATQSDTLFADLQTASTNSPDLSHTNVLGEALGRLWIAANPFDSEVRLFTAASPNAPLTPFPIAPVPSGPLVDVADLGNGRAVLTTGFISTSGALSSVISLFVTDGTSAGTGLLPIRLESEVVVAGGRAYFLGLDLTEGLELFSTDGTVAGTRAETAFNSGANLSQFARPADGEGRARLVASSSHVYFAVIPATTGLVQVHALPLGGGPSVIVQETNGSSIATLSGRALGDRLVYVLDPSTNLSSAAEVEPRISNGTLAGTALLRDIAPGAHDSDPQFLGADGAFVWFSAENQATGRELWRTDGTPAGTAQVLDLEPGSADGITKSFSTATAAPFAGGLAFAGRTTSIGDELWFTDGTAAGTALIADLEAGAESSGPDRLFALGGQLYFAAPESAGGSFLRRPWVSDGTPAGTQELTQPLSATQPDNPTGFSAFGGRVYFSCRDQVVGTSLWSTDGTPSGTRFEADLAEDFVNQSSEPKQFFAADGQAFFKARQGNQTRLFVTDGTPGDARALVTLGLSTEEVPIGTLGASVVFYRNTAFGNEPWISDGTLAGTSLLKNLNPEPLGTFSQGGSFIEGPKRDDDWRTVVLGTRLFFAADTPSTGSELFVTDGTTAGTGLLIDLIPGVIDGWPQNLTVFGDRLAFSARSSINAFNWSLWVSDGTAGGTTDVGPLLPDRPNEIVVLDDWLYFSYLGFPLGEGAVYRSDGTTAGTQRLLDGNVVDLAVAGERLLVLALDGVRAIEADGSVTQLLDRALPVGGAAGGEVVVASSDAGVHFVAFPELSFASGITELWFTDGTPGGTRLVDSSSSSFTSLGSGGRVALSSFDISSGREPHTSEPGSDQPVLVVDAADGLQGTAPQLFDTARLGDTLFYAATDPELGIELHTLSVTGSGGYVAEPYGQGCGSAGPVRLDLEGAARLGEAVAVTVENAKPAGVVGLYAAGRPTLQGIDGCTLLIDGLLPIGSGLTDVNGSASLPFQLSTNPFWVGRELYLQALVIAPGGPLGGLLELTNGLELVFGQ